MDWPANITDMPNEIWETYCALVWCNNSLNAAEGAFRHFKDNGIADLLSRAQWVIITLLEDSGRLKEFEEYVERKEITNGRV